MFEILFSRYKKEVKSYYPYKIDDWIGFFLHQKEKIVQSKELKKQKKERNLSSLIKIKF
tara:strand:- start:354 stop:530 length:177 start_codon:yes stop_codon:yes gene_type:complete